MSWKTLTSLVEVNKVHNILILNITIILSCLHSTLMTQGAFKDSVMQHSEFCTSQQRVAHIWTLAIANTSSFQPPAKSRKPSFNHIYSGDIICRYRIMTGHSKFLTNLFILISRIKYNLHLEISTTIHNISARSGSLYIKWYNTQLYPMNKGNLSISFLNVQILKSYPIAYMFLVCITFRHFYLIENIIYGYICKLDKNRRTQ